MHSIRIAHVLIGFVMVLISSATCLEHIKTSQAFRVQSYAASGKSQSLESYPDQNVDVDFTNCEPDGYPIYGSVTSMTINPCDRSTSNGPCTFIFRHNYTIELDFQTTLNSAQPRSSVLAYDDDGAYQYSGQSFNGCKYATCPIRAETPSTYVYHFQTLASPFTSLTFNVTRNFTGPSLFCASTNIIFAQTPSIDDVEIKA